MSPRFVQMSPAYSAKLQKMIIFNPFLKVSKMGIMCNRLVYVPKMYLRHQYNLLKRNQVMSPRYVQMSPAYSAKLQKN